MPYSNFAPVYVCQRNFTQVNVGTHVRIFISALFVLVVMGCYLECPLLRKWLGKMWWLNTMGTRQD